MKSKRDQNLFRLVLAALMLAFCMVLPFLTGQVQQIANKVSLMHLPVMLAGYFCGPWYGLAIGVIAPLMRSVLFHMPALFPNDPSLNYNNLKGPVHNGGDAMTIFPQLAKMTDPLEVQRLRNSLLAYCHLDTLAMVKVWEKLREMAKGVV